MDTEALYKQIAEHRCAEIMCNLANTPEHVLLEAKRQQEIDAHNAEVDRVKAEKRQHKATLAEMGIRRNIRNNA